MSVYKPSYRDPKTGEKKQQNTWWYHFTFAGRHIQESSKSTRKTVALEAEKKRRRELEQVYNGVPTATKPQQRVRTVAIAMKEYQTAYAVNHRPKATATLAERAPHIVRILGSTMLSDLTENRMAEYMALRLDEAQQAAKARAKKANVKLEAEDLLNLGHRTVNMELEILARALGSQWGMLWPKLKRLEEPRDTGRALSAEEEQKLLEAAAKNRSPMALPFLKIALSTGMRFKEIRTMKWARIDLAKRVLHVGESKTAAGTGRGVPLNDGLYRTLLEHSFQVEKRLKRPPAPDDYLFPFSKRAGPLDPTQPIQSINSAWDSIREQTGIDCRFHDLRHTAYSKLDAAEVPEQVIMAIMGHVSKQMRERYSHARMDAMRDAMKHLDLDNPIEPAKESAKVRESAKPRKPLTH